MKVALMIEILNVRLTYEICKLDKHEVARFFSSFLFFYYYYYWLLNGLFNYFFFSLLNNSFNLMNKFCKKY